MTVPGSLERLLVRAGERYQTLSLRERALIALTLGSITWLAWSFLLADFVDTAKRDLDGQVRSLNRQVQLEVDRQVSLEAANADDPSTRLGRERIRLEAELKALNTSLGSVLERFVAPGRMPQLLRDVIRHHDGLKLKRIVSLPVETVRLPSAAAAIEEEDDEEFDEAAYIESATGRTNGRDAVARQKPTTHQPPVIYRHPLRLEFEGDYFEVLAYLAELEAGDWKLGWRALEYVVDEYPRASVTLEIETLSMEKSWIGV